MRNTVVADIDQIFRPQCGSCLTIGTLKRFHLFFERQHFLFCHAFGSCLIRGLVGGRLNVRVLEGFIPPFAIYFVEYGSGDRFEGFFVVGVFIPSNHDCNIRGYKPNLCDGPAYVVASGCKCSSHRFLCFSLSLTPLADDIDVIVVLRAVGCFGFRIAAIPSIYAVSNHFTDCGYVSEKVCL